MTSSRVLVALLCFTTWVSVVQATHARLPRCDCPGWSTTRVSPRRVVNYTRQSESDCKINVVVFQRRGGRKICSDPNSNWAKKVILKVDKEQSLLQQNRQNQDASTSTASPAPPHQRRLTSAASPAPPHQSRLTSAASPAPSLPLKTMRPKKCGKGRRRQKNKTKGGRRCKN
ncbi:eotaxin-like [Pungitius pungitius]|uniref:eotaxin-like n=1 Tax=Pungitius pungitius TaxID=134920 RepID=UPI002E167F9F